MNDAPYKPKVIVIGAGAAGLAASQQLCAGGASVCCLEARGRVGGRIWTVHDRRFGFPVELGAEFIHGRSPAIWQLISDRSSLDEISGQPWCAFAGKLQPCSEIWGEIEDLLQKVKDFAEHSGKDESLTNFLLRQPPSSVQARERLLSYVEGFDAADPCRISVQSIAREVDAEGRIDGDRQFRCKAGYDQLIDALNPRASNFELRLKTVVRRVRWSGAGVQVDAQTDEGRRSFTASRAVITLPLSILQAASEVVFDPPLASKFSALNGLVMGHVVRVSLVFRRRFWAEDALSGNRPGKLKDMTFLFSDHRDFPTWWTRQPETWPVLTGWAAGSHAQRLIPLDQEQISERAISALAELTSIAPSNLRAELLASFTHEWQMDPFSRGAYSYAAVGGFNAAAELAQPLGPLFFAGEATDSNGYHSTVHGAVASGRRAAREVLATL